MEGVETTIVVTSLFIICAKHVEIGMVDFWRSLHLRSLGYLGSDYDDIAAQIDMFMSKAAKLKTRAVLHAHMLF